MQNNYKTIEDVMSKYRNTQTIINEQFIIINNETLKSITEPSQIETEYIKELAYYTIYSRDREKPIKEIPLLEKQIIDNILKDLQLKTYEKIQSYLNNTLKSNNKCHYIYDQISVDDVNYAVIAIHKNGTDDETKFIENISLPYNNKNHHTYDEIFVLEMNYVNCNNNDEFYIFQELYQLNPDEF